MNQISQTLWKHMLTHTLEMDSSLSCLSVLLHQEGGDGSREQCRQTTVAMTV